MIWRRGGAVLAVTLAVSVGLVGCTSSTLADQYRAGDGKGYISGDGSVTTIKVGDRGTPVDFSGATIDGSVFSSSRYLGRVVVVNFWYAGCAPCRVEAKDLESISKDFAARGVQFIGVNTRDRATNARSFDTDYGITYPSILDAATGSVQLAFSKSAPPRATPTTIVLDARGRVAARILGPISDQPSTLTTLITDTLAEKSSK